MGNTVTGHSLYFFMISLGSPLATVMHPTENQGTEKVSGAVVVQIMNDLLKCQISLPCVNHHQSNMGRSVIDDK